MAGDDPGDMGDINEGAEQVVMNENPHFLMSTYYAATTFLSSYGWFIVFAVVFLIILWSNIERKVKKLVEKSQNSGGQDLSPDILAKRAEAMELARQRQQEKASAILQREAERRRELEEQKRAEKISDYDAMKSGKSSSSTQKKLHQNETSSSTSSSNNSKPRNQARPLRDNDFNPLTGSSSTRYRPAPRRTGGG